MLDTVALSIGMDDVEIDGFLAALFTAGSVGLFLAIAATVLIAFHYLDAWKEEKDSPVGRAVRKRHFGGV